jgi:hypothetical protein
MQKQPQNTITILTDESRYKSCCLLSVPGGRSGVCPWSRAGVLTALLVRGLYVIAVADQRAHGGTHGVPVGLLGFLIQQVVRDQPGIALVVYVLRDGVRSV